MKNSINYIKTEKIKSKWYDDIFAQWQPNKEYIEFLKTSIKNNRYIAPVVVVKEGNFFYIVNGHHRYYALAETGQETVKCIVIQGTFEESEPLRKAEVLLKEFDQKTKYRYQFSGYLDRWAAAAEQHDFINKYRPVYTYKFRIYQVLKKIKDIFFKTAEE